MLLSADIDIPYLQESLGLWLIEPNAATSLFNLLQETDLAKHLISAQVEQAKSFAQNAKDTGSAYRQDIEGVAHISLAGPLQKHVSSFSGGTSTVLARRDINNAAKDPNIGAILLRIDSPGGTSAGTYEIANDIANAAGQKPVLAHCTDLCASAAYWVGSSAQELLATEASLVGSIGTYAVLSDYSAAAAQRGIKVHVIRAGKFKGMGVDGTEITTEQLQEFQRMVDSRNSLFLDAVAKNRKMQIDQVTELADGRVHTAKEAQKLGLIDGVMTLEQAHAKARDLIKKPTVVKGARMTTENTAASVREIKNACPGCNSDFIVECQEKGLAVADCASAWTLELSQKNTELQASIKKLETERDALKAEVTTLKTENAALVEAANKAKEQPGKKAGAPLLPEGKSDATSATPEDAYWGEVKKQQQSGKTRAEAMTFVNKNFPELRMALHAEAV